jgi:3-oxoacyl-(acyl-carrier-protein) synthase
VNRAFISDFEILSPLGDARGMAQGLFSGRSGLTNLDGRYGDVFPVQAIGLIESLKGERRPNQLACELIATVLKRNSSEPFDGLVFSIPQDDEFANRSAPPNTDAQAVLLTETMQQLPETIAIHEACVSGLSALSLAAQRVRAGVWRRALVVAVDLRCSPLDLLRFHAIGALSLRRAPEASCPFSLERDGFVKAQGAGVFLIESNPNDAWAEIAGYGHTCDAWRMTEGHPEAQGIVTAMQRAMALAKWNSEDVDALFAHATSTPVGDALEARALQSLSVHWPVVALQSYIGHCGQASGLMQVASALIMMKEQMLAPTLNFQTPDSRCEVSGVTEPRQTKLNRVLCNASAFGGLNVSLALQKI